MSSGAGPEFTDLSASELFGGQSGVEGGCHDPSPVVRDVALDERVGGFRPSDVLALAVGEHSAEIRWLTLAPPEGARDFEVVTVQLELNGTPRWHSSACGSYLDLPVHYRLFSSDGSIELEADGTLSSTDGREAHLSTDGQSFPLNQNWTTRIQSTLNTNGSEVFEPTFTFDALGTRGSVSVRGVGLCTLLEWPPAPCQIGIDDPVYGERVREILQHLDANPQRLSTSEFRWDDDTVTALNVEVVSRASTACIGYVAHEELLFRDVVVAVELRVSTADGRVKAVLPGSVRGMVSDEARWSRLRFEAELSRRPAELGTFDLPQFDGNERVVISLAGDSKLVMFDIDALVPVSDDLRDTNLGCAHAPADANGFAGAGWLTPVLYGWWESK